MGRVQATDCLIWVLILKHNMELKSKTNNRIIVEGVLNGKSINLLVDTGATVGLIDKNQIKKLGIEKGREFPSHLVGANGKMDAWHCYQLVDIGGKQVGQFLIADIDAVVDSIERETGVKISGILSLPQMAMMGAVIDTMGKRLVISD